jgi:thiamine biosynthesis lipoprotein
MIRGLYFAHLHPILQSISLILLLFLKPLDGSDYFTFSEKCMGTDFKIIIDDTNESTCQKVAKEAFEEAHRLNNIFSDYLADSEASVLSASSFNDQDDEYLEISAELLNVLKFSRELSKDTSGDFDITIGPASRLWRIARFRESLPGPDKIKNALTRIGFNKILFHPSENKVRLDHKGMLLDFGGIAKGFAGDQMLTLLKDSGLNRCLIDAGGDLIIGQAPKGKPGWRVKIGGEKHPELPSLSLSNCAVATSGDTEQFAIIGGKAYSHIINPHTGIGLNTRAQVTVIAKNGMIADSLASAALVSGLKSSEKIFEKYYIKAAFFISQEDGVKKLSKYTELQ